jgi:hypothetical protein
MPGIAREWVIGGLTDVIDVIERGLWTLGDWERNHIAAAIVQMNAGNHQAAQNFVLKTIWPPGTRAGVPIVRVTGAEELTLKDLKVEIEQARERSADAAA